jgi:hypothetical protein
MRLFPSTSEQGERAARRKERRTRKMDEKEGKEDGSG